MYVDKRLEGVNPVQTLSRLNRTHPGIAAGWAFYDIKWKKIAPRAFVFGVTNPVMVQGAIFAGIPIADGWKADGAVATGDRVRLDPGRRVVEILQRRH